jgi:hypothetical protein
MRPIITVLLLGGLLVAACGGEASDDITAVPLVTDSVVSDGLPLADDDTATDLSGMGPGISVAEAVASTLDEPLLVNGYVFVFADGSVVFADLIAESFPPQPAGATVTVEGLDVMQIPLTEGPAEAEIAITAWTDIPVQLTGEMVDGVFVVSPVASA